MNHDSPEPVRLEFTTDEGFGRRARLGVIVLESDQTIEAELRLLDLDGVVHYVARIANDAIVSPETLATMEARLPHAASLLPVEFGFDVIGYACTSAATLIGESGVEAAIRSVHPGVRCTSPVSAAVAAFRALGVERIGVVTPYTAAVTARVVGFLEGHGLTISAVGSFLEESDLVVARISEQAVANGVLRIGMSEQCEAVFVSCTSLRTSGIVSELEAQLGKPVVSSNLAFIWHLLRLAGVEDAMPGVGRLLGCRGERGDR